VTHHRKAAVAAFGAYTALTLLMTWPLATGMTRDVPGDLGDSLLNMWILGWGAEQAPRVLTGQIALHDYWNANIFHPEPLALGFSEHLFGLVVQVLPVYWLTGNLILCYNLLFLSSFALSGLGMFLLVRELLHDDTRLQHATAVTLAAFIAGLVFAFLPFRIAQVAHIQSLQAQWMPLALYGFRRFIVTGRTHSLLGGASALLMQNWANGYYLIFFAPFVPIFVLHQMWASGQLRRLRLWLGFVGAAVAVVLATMPFLMLYLETGRAHTFTRPIGEVIRFSADVYSYLTAPDALGLWGKRLQAFPKPEGELFFGFTPWVLAAIALVTIFARSSRPADAPVSPVPVRFSLPVTALIAIVAVQSAGLLAILFTGGFVTSVGGIPIRANNPMRILIGIAVAAAILLLISPGIRAHVRAAMRTPLVLSAVLACAALWLSLGPVPQAMGQPIPGLGVYRVLYDHVPGFDGLRVPARYAMIAAVFLCVVAGFGAKTLLAWRGPVAWRWPGLATLIVAAAFLAEAAFAPMSVNLTWGDGAVIPPPRVEAAQDAPAVYHTLARLPENAVVAEFPFGDPAWELRYVYYSTVHWKRLLNGYSGGFPHGYLARAARLQRIRENPDDAWRALREAGATHVIVHERAFPAGEAAVVTRWLTDRFAVEIARFDGDLLFDLTGIWPTRGQGQARHRAQAPGPRSQ
jgi:hypothetical protein